MIGKYADTIKLRKELTPFIDKYGHISCDITKFNILLERSTADAEEVKRGRWIDVEHAPNGLLYATCSVCGKRQTIEATNYCGNCGADMREKKNECDDCFVPMFYNLEDDDSICRDCGVGE